jgi:hypothetical protein
MGWWMAGGRQMRLVATDVAVMWLYDGADGHEREELATNAESVVQQRRSARKQMVV